MKRRCTALSNEKMSDVTFEIIEKHQTTTIRGIRSMFGTLSAVFRNMLFGNMIESHAAEVVRIYDLTPETFEFLKRYFSEKCISKSRFVFVGECNHLWVDYRFSKLKCDSGLYISGDIVGFFTWMQNLFPGLHFFLYPSSTRHYRRQ